MKELREIPTENLVAARRIYAVKATETDGNMGKKQKKQKTKQKQQQQQQQQQKKTAGCRTVSLRFC